MRQHFGLAIRDKNGRRVSATLGLADSQRDRRAFLQQMRDLAVERIDARAQIAERVGLRGHLRTRLALIVGHGTAHITPFRRLSGAETPMGSRQPNKLLP